MKKEGLKAKDFITVGIFTALLLVVEFACGMLGFIHPYIVASYVVMIPLVGSIREQNCSWFSLCRPSL